MCTACFRGWLSAQGCVSARGCLPMGGVWPGGVCLGDLPHTPYGQTDTCENITLLQTSFAGGKNVVVTEHVVTGTQCSCTDVSDC